MMYLRGNALLEPPDVRALFFSCFKYPGGRPSWRHWFEPNGRRAGLRSATDNRHTP